MPDALDLLILKSYEGTLWKQGAENFKGQAGAVEEVHEWKYYWGDEMEGISGTDYIARRCTRRFRYSTWRKDQLSVYAFWKVKDVGNPSWWSEMLKWMNSVPVSLICRK